MNMGQQEELERQGGWPKVLQVEGMTGKRVVVVRADPGSSPVRDYRCGHG